MDVTPEQSVIAACRNSLTGKMNKCLLDGDDAWNADDMNGAMDLSVTIENNMDHDILTDNEYNLNTDALEITRDNPELTGEAAHNITIQ